MNCYKFNDINLNDEVTLGYDADGPKVLILYPTGKKY